MEPEDRERRQCDRYRERVPMSRNLLKAHIAVESSTATETDVVGVEYLEPRDWPRKPNLYAS